MSMPMQGPAAVHAGTPFTWMNVYLPSSCSIGVACGSSPWKPNVYETRPTTKFRPEPVREATLGWSRWLFCAAREGREVNRGDWQGRCAADALHPSGMTAAHVSNLCKHSVHRQCCVNLRRPHCGRSKSLQAAPGALGTRSTRSPRRFPSRRGRCQIVQERHPATQKQCPQNHALRRQQPDLTSPSRLVPDVQHLACQPSPTCMAAHTCSSSRRHCGSSPTASARDRRNRPSSNLAASAIQAANRKAPDCGAGGQQQAAPVSSD